MQTLVKYMVDLADQQAKTPVIVSSRKVQLQPDFFIAMATAMLPVCRREIRFELLSEPISSLLFWHRRRNLCLLRHLNKLNAVGVHAGLVGMVSRPAGKERPLVIGIASKKSPPLPGWAEVVAVDLISSQQLGFHRAA